MAYIDVEKLSPEELYDLYRRIVRRINALHRSRLAEKLQEFEIKPRQLASQSSDFIKSETRSVLSMRGI